MLILCLVIEIVMALIIMLANNMMAYCFNKIRTSMKLFGSKRNYKTQTDIAFIEQITKEYEERPMDDQSLYYIICNALQKSNIGKFSYMMVINIARQGVLLMWGVLAIGGMLMVINKISLKEPMTIAITASVSMLTIVMTLYTMIKALPQKEKGIIGEVIHYVKITYPMIKEKELEKELEKQLHVEAAKIITLPIKEKENLHSEEECRQHTHKREMGTLKAKDIAQFIEKI